LRSEAERHLQALAGPQAQLREDQWSAITALAADRRRVLVVQRTGWGKSAVYFIATALLRAWGARADGHRLSAARADAQPDGGRRAGRHPGRPRAEAVLT
jgi:superfamily II DNA helicase RecQ